MKKLVSALMVTVMVAGFSMPVYACTPSLKTPSVEIPDINFKPDGALGDAIDNAVKNWIEKCILEQPTVNYATYFKSTLRYFNYAVFSANWNEVENATSYKQMDLTKNLIQHIHHFMQRIIQMNFLLMVWMMQP